MGLLANEVGKDICFLAAYNLKSFLFVAHSKIDADKSLV